MIRIALLSSLISFTIGYLLNGYLIYQEQVRGNTLSVQLSDKPMKPNQYKGNEK